MRARVEEAVRKGGERFYLTPRVPQGLAAAVEGLTREVIRHRPDNIYIFAAQHFEKLLRLREEYERRGTDKSNREISVERKVIGQNEGFQNLTVRESETKEMSGWSLGETARVLERYRSIFGERGQKMSTEQVRELAKEAVSLDPGNVRATPAENITPRKKKRSGAEVAKSRGPDQRDPKRALRIISQIPLAKDMKTELRRNRISSKERRRTAAPATTACECGRTPFPDRARSYASHNLAGTRSLNELQSPSYVEKVQEVIDETSLLIKEKVEALKAGVVKASRTRREEAPAEQTSHEPDDVLLPVVRPPSSRSTPRSLSGRSDSDGLVLPPISPETNKSPKAKEDLVLPVLSPPRSAPRTPEDIEEQFHDSLNATPEPRDESQRPDSLEPSEVGSARDSPHDTLKEKLLEIEEVQRRIEGAFNKDADDEERVPVIAELKGKLAEIQNSERRIEEILDSQSGLKSSSSTNTIDAHVIDKLKELEDVEERIKNILVDEVTNRIDIIEGHVNERVELQEEQTTDEDQNTEISKSNLQSEKMANAVSSHTSEWYSAQIGTTSRALSPHSYVLTEGSPYDIPDSVTTVIIPERMSTPDDSLRVELDMENNKIYSTLVSSADIVTTNNFSENLHVTDEKITTTIDINDAFGEPVSKHDSPLEILNEDIELLNRVSQCDAIIYRKELTLIKEERDKEAKEEMDSEDEKVLKVVTSSLEEILEKDEVEYVSKEDATTILKSRDPKFIVQSIEYEFTDETRDTSITEDLTENIAFSDNPFDIEKTTARSDKSENEIKDTSINDRPDSTSDPAIPFIPELNLDSLPDLTISSFNTTDEEQKEGQSDSTNQKSNSLINIIAFETAKEAVSFDMETSIGNKNISSNLEPNMQELDKSTASLDLHNPVPLIDDVKQKNHVYSGKTTNTSNSLAEEIGECVIGFEKLEYNNSAKSVNIYKTEITEVTEVTEITQNYEVVENTYLLENETKDRDSDREVEIVDENIIKSVIVDLNESNHLISNTGKEVTRLSEDATQQELSNQNENMESITSSKKTEVSIPFADANGINSKKDEKKVQENKDSVFESSEVKLNDKSELKNCENQKCVPTINEDKIKSLSTVINKSFNINCNVSTTSENFEKNEVKSYESPAPGMNVSKDLSSSTETSTFLSAATKIQAGVRGFITRRRLQSTQRRSSTLDSVPSIQESFTAESSSTTCGDISGASAATTVALDSRCTLGQPLAAIAERSEILPDAAVELRKKKQLRREDAVQRTTLSVENAFAENQLQHTGEFHDCLPLPPLAEVPEGSRPSQTRGASLCSGEQLLLGQLFLERAAAQYVQEVLLLPASEVALQQGYLDFITSVEDARSELLGTARPSGITIEEITSLSSCNDESLSLNAGEEPQTSSPDPDRQSSPLTVMQEALVSPDNASNGPNDDGLTSSSHLVADEVQPIELIKQIEPAGPEESAEPTKSTELMEPSEPTEPTQSAELAESVPHSQDDTISELSNV